MLYEKALRLVGKVEEPGRFPRNAFESECCPSTHCGRFGVLPAWLHRDFTPQRCCPTSERCTDCLPRCCFDSRCGSDEAVDALESLIKQKFQYVISCQVYGKQKRGEAQFLGPSSTAAAGCWKDLHGTGSLAHLLNLVFVR